MSHILDYYSVENLWQISHFPNVVCCLEDFSYSVYLKNINTFPTKTGGHMINRKTKWLVLSVSDILIQILVLVLFFPQRITDLCYKDIFFAVVSLGWVLLAPRVHKLSVKMLLPLVWFGTAAIIRSPVMMLLFGIVFILEFLSDASFRNVMAKGNLEFSATEIITGLGFVCIFAIFSTASPDVNADLSTALLFVSFLLKLNISPVRMSEYPERSINSYLLARRGIQFAHSFLGNTFLIIGAPILLIDILAYVLMYKREFDQNLFARKRIIHQDEKNELAEIKMTTRVIISGPSSVGKDAIIKELLDRVPNARLSVSATTRAPRLNEVNGVDYYFKTAEEFEQMICNCELVEYTKYDSHYYGTLMREDGNPGEIIIYNVEPNGHNALKDYFSDAISIFIAAPGEKVEKRMRKRDKTATEEEIQSRMGTAADILRRSVDYDFFIMNDYSVGDAVSQIEKILAVQELRACAQSQTIKNLTQSFLKYE